MQGKLNKYEKGEVNNESHKGKILRTNKPCYKRE